jgi:hypothetical protein
MSIQPDGEDLRRAVEWIAEEKLAAPQRPLRDLIEAACLKFDLSPMAAEHLLRAVKAGNR